MKHYLESADNVIRSVDSSKDGLSAIEAQKRLERNGKNKLAEAKKESLLHRFFKQLSQLGHALFDLFGRRVGEVEPQRGNRP